MALEQGCGALAVGADDDAVGVQEVGDGGSFAEKLGVGDDVEEVDGRRRCARWRGVIHSLV